MQRKLHGSSVISSVIGGKRFIIRIILDNDPLDRAEIEAFPPFGMIAIREVHPKLHLTWTGIVKIDLGRIATADR